MSNCHKLSCKLRNYGSIRANGSRSDQWSHFCLRLDHCLASFKPYLLLLLMHMSLLLLIFVQLNSIFLLCFSLAKVQIYGSWLSHILDIPSIMIFSIWCIQYITWYTPHLKKSPNKPNQKWFKRCMKALVRQVLL